MILLKKVIIIITISKDVREGTIEFEVLVEEVIVEQHVLHITWLCH